MATQFKKWKELMVPLDWFTIIMSICSVVQVLQHVWFYFFTKTWGFLFSCYENIYSVIKVRDSCLYFCRTIISIRDDDWKGYPCMYVTSVFQWENIHLCKIQTITWSCFLFFVAWFKSCWCFSLTWPVTESELAPTIHGPWTIKWPTDIL